MVIAFCRKPLAGSLMISAKVFCSNHPEEATLPLRCLATATPLKMPVPHLNIRIVQRSNGNSAVAGAAYQAGERLFSEYDQQWKNYLRKKEVVYTEIMLPINAPPEYADRATLWNSAENILCQREYVVILQSMTQTHRDTIPIATSC